MFTVFLYEFISGGGLFQLAGESLLAESLLGEGLTMWRSLAEDLAQIPSVQVVSLRDGRITSRDADVAELRRVTGARQELESFDELAREADVTIMIAPEFDDHLLSRALRLERNEVRLVSPCSRFVRLAADKSKLAQVLSQVGVPTPTGRRVEQAEYLPTEFPFPAVLKPNHGAGSIGVRRVDDRRVAAGVGPVTETSRLESLVVGLPASIGFLCGHADHVALPPFQQQLSAGGFAYQGGRRIMDPVLCRRAEDLGRRAIAALPRTAGYVGVDLVLGASRAGADDYVIEVNPRLTTSYIGLRAIAKTNLAAAMLSLARGISHPLAFSAEYVEFDSDGTLRTGS